jgi:hypothetical protein
MNSKMDPMGRAIADYWKNKKADSVEVVAEGEHDDYLARITKRV